MAGFHCRENKKLLKGYRTVMIKCSDFPQKMDKDYSIETLSVYRWYDLGIVEPLQC